MINTNKVIRNILGKKKYSRRYLKQIYTKNRLKQTYTKEELIFLLQKLAKEVHGTPTISDLRYSFHMPSYTAYTNYFGSWNNALREAGLKITLRREYTKEELIQILQQLAQELNKIPVVEDLNQRKDLPSHSTYKEYFSTWNNALREAGFVPTQRHDYTKEELIQILQQFAQEIGRTPTTENIDKRSDLPAYTTYKRYFSTWNNALKEAGLIE